MESKQPRWSSRKLLILQEVILLCSILPFLMIRSGITSDVITMVIFVIGALSGAYFGVNILEKKETFLGKKETYHGER